MRFSVVVPSYRRPEALALCLDGLARQDRAPDEVIVVARSSDAVTLEVVRDAGSSAVRAVEVNAAGLLPAMQAGAGAATGDAIAFTDDDAIPRADWLRRLEGHFADPAVGAVGGRDVLPFDAGAETTDVGRITAWGRLVGNQHLAVGRARPVDVLKGVNLAFRRAALAVPAQLRGRGSQVHWEIAMCGWARTHGWRIVFDPQVIVDHYPGRRVSGDTRVGSARDVRDASYNLVFAIASFYPQRVWRRAAYGLLVGDRMTPGLLRATIGAARREPEVGRVALAAMRGQVEALVAISRGRRQQMVPLVARPAAVPAALVGVESGRGGPA